MTVRNSTARWGSVARIFHWVSAILVIAMIALGWVAHEWPLSPTKIELYALHKATGILVLAITLPRLMWRLMNPTPALPGTLKPYERLLAKATHGALYALIIALPLSGYVINAAADFPLNFYGLFVIPNLIGPDDALKELTASVHFYLSSALIGVIALHVGAALKHHYILKDDVLTRMLPGRGQA